MTPKDQLERMLRLQELALEIREAERLIEQAPVRIEEIEQRFRERNAEYVALRDRYEELDRDQKERQAALEDLEAARKKYMEDLMQVKNQREYAAMLKEIDTVKAAIAENEEAVLKDMEEMESLKGELERFTSQIQEERTQVEEERRAVEAEVEAAHKRLEASRAERARIEGELPPDLLSTLRRIEGGRQGVFMAQVKDGMCQACFVRVRPQVFQEIRLAKKLHMCSQCRRFLYYAEAVGGPARSAGGGAGSSKVEAADGSHV